MWIWLVGCVSLAGTWSGVVTCADDGADALTWTLDDPTDDIWAGTGELACGASCVQRFGLTVRDAADVADGEDLVDVDVDDCVQVLAGDEAAAACANTEAVVLDGDHMSGTWNDCAFEVERT